MELSRAFLYVALFVYSTSTCWYGYILVSNFCNKKWNIKHFFMHIVFVFFATLIINSDFNFDREGFYIDILGKYLFMVGFSLVASPISWAFVRLFMYRYGIDIKSRKTLDKG